jgi:hypothetical protein
MFTLIHTLYHYNKSGFRAKTNQIKSNPQTTDFLPTPTPASSRKTPRVSHPNRSSPRTRRTAPRPRRRERRTEVRKRAFNAHEFTQVRDNFSKRRIRAHAHLVLTQNRGVARGFEEDDHFTRVVGVGVGHDGRRTTRGRLK